MQPYYQDELVSLWHGHNQEVLEGLDTSAVDLLLTDPPYGVGWNTDYRRCMPSSISSMAQQITPPSAQTWQPLTGDQQAFNPSPWLVYPQVILWGANCYSESLPRGRWLVWDKRFASGKSFLPSDAEVAWMKGGHGVRIYAQTWQGVARSNLHPSERGQTPGHPVAHPTQKPVALGVWCIQQAKKVQLVLDPYAGSGSFLISAKSLGLKAWGVELEEAYCETAAKRLEQTLVEEQA